MTINEAISKIDNLKPNDYTTANKIEWLSTLDGLIKNEIIDTHEDSDGVTFNGYTVDTPGDTALLVSAPYDDIYIHWLESRIDYANAEYAKYNNSVTRFNDSFLSFGKYYNRTKMPTGTDIKYL